MKPVEQRIFYNEDAGTRGDCLKCCVASLLELDYDDVPHFAGMGEFWWIEWTNWLAERGWILGTAYWTVDVVDRRRLTGWAEGYWLAAVLSPRTRSDGSHLNHMVVMRDSELVWDPHPARADGHLGFIDGYRLYPYDPASFTPKTAR